jgi:hypothetical protein
MYPATRTAKRVCGEFIRKMRHCGEPYPFALKRRSGKRPPMGADQSPVLWAGLFTKAKYEQAFPTESREFRLVAHGLRFPPPERLYRRFIYISLRSFVVLHQARI